MLLEGWQDSVLMCGWFRGSRGSGLLLRVLDEWVDLGASWTLSRNELVCVAGVGAGLVSSGIRLVAMSPMLRYPPILTRDEVRLSVVMWTEVE